MNDREASTRGEFANPAERVLHEQLGAVRSEPPTPGKDLELAVLRTLRWQSLIVVPLHALGALAGGLISGLRALAGSRGTS